MDKEHFKKKQKTVFLGWLWTFLVKMAFCGKIGKHYWCSEGKKLAFSLTLAVLGKWYFFLWPYELTKHYKNRGFSRRRGKPRMALLVAKVPFWEGVSTGVLISVMHKSCVLLKTPFLSVSANHSFAEIKECKLQKRQMYQKLGVVCQHAKRCFLFVFLFVVLWLLSLCFGSVPFLNWKSPRKAILLQF